MAGRRPKPLAMHQLNGNPSMLNQAELSGADNPQPERSYPEMPKGMPKGAKREWKKICPLLLTNGLLTKVDGKALMGYCVCYARWQEANALIDKWGPVIETSYFDTKSEMQITGDLKANPAVAQADKWLSRMKSFLVEFGLTPASRRNLKVQKNDAGDEMEKYLRKGKAQSAAPIYTPVRPEDMSAGDEAEAEIETEQNPSE